MTTFKTADICDLHGDTVQVCRAPLFSFGGRPWLAGRIATVETFEDAALVRQALDQPGEGCVLVVDGGGSRRVAILGDKLAHLAIRNGWTGIVINGAVRDLDVLGRMDVAIFALGAVPLRGGMTGTGRAAVAVRFGDATFTPGACIHGDRDGLISCPHEMRLEALNAP